ncbi:uncharacterized protein LOC116989735 isoform X2 [Amblyraja radiata]|uniref:uncharacterized protein LOC116989735 isoform X2 n=1 Tax=Amblyraja radiata TaxID=386614 RepID=UPI001403D7CE|nr:uncharacterized protein LOC116989735 isoform X2 [Amblyraja radiata]
MKRRSKNQLNVSEVNKRDSEREGLKRPSKTQLNVSEMNERDSGRERLKKHSKVNIAPLKTLPNALINLYTGDTPQDHEFRKNIRQYNCLFQLTSFGAKEVVAHGWNPSVIIQGQIYHFIGSLMPDQDQQSKFLLIYFMDPHDSIDLRMSILQDAGIQRDTVEMLENMIRLNNPYIDSLVMTTERIRDLPEASIVIDPNYRPPLEHERRFNTQTANVVAVLIPKSNQPAATSRHIVLSVR